MINYSNILSITALCIILSACVGSPEQVQKPSAADKVQTSGVDRFNSGDYSIALDQFKRALHGNRVLDDAEGIVTSCINISRTYHAKGELVAARNWVHKAAEVNRELSPANHQRLHDNLTLLAADIEIDAGNIEQAKKALDSIDKSTDHAVRLYVLKLRTEIAFIEETDTAGAVEAYAAAVRANSTSSPVHPARLARFRAALETDHGAQAKLYTQALDIYRDLGKHSAIASTLSEWATADMAAGDMPSAEKKLLRSLYIRAGSTDRKKSIASLEQLRRLYADNTFTRATPVPVKEQDIAYWLEKLGDTGFSNWTGLLQAFDTYPR